MMHSHSFARVCALKAALAACVLGSAAAQADQQRDPELRAVIERAIVQAECFADRYDSAVWYKLMEPKLRKLVQDDPDAGWRERYDAVGTEEILVPRGANG